MSIFQKSVVNKYLKYFNEKKVNLAYNNFQKFYGNKERLHNIMQLKEVNYQEGFLREIFVQVLGYTINPDNDYNLTTEFKNHTDSRKADGAILKDGDAIAVIELKSTKTKDLESIKEQAFGYKNNQANCKYVITSNFQSIRFYIDNATEYEEFNLFEMANGTDVSRNVFTIFYLLLSNESILNNLPDKLKQETKFHEEEITKKLYKDYKSFKERIFDFLCNGNPQYDKLTLFKKSQKLLDRFLFILFAEDSGLIPPNSISKIIDQWKQLQELEEYKTLYSRFQLFFTHLYKGHVYKNWGEIPAYNGGLFRYDEILDNTDLKLPDGLLQNNLPILSAYDFGSEVDVNILGHIFEHSLSEIEDLTAELQGKTIDKTKSKRKKDGIFYTPKYITKYIVENTLGTLCNEKKTELHIKGLLIDDTFYQKNGKLNQKGNDLFETLQKYKDWLLTLKILDPACGSGAFLNQTLDFLIAEHKEIDSIIAELTGNKMVMFDTDKTILENNIYGVDINEESVEIAKLSLWLRTAERGRLLSDLSGNIKCGNSLIDDPEVAGEKAFEWEKEFPHVFNPDVKDKVYQKLPESKPDYVKLVKDKSKEAQEKAEQAAKLSKEALEISKQVYEYAEKIETVNEPNIVYGTKTGGFDVVLGNPPYVLCQPSNTKQEILEYYKTYKVASYKIDLFHLFFEKSIDILKTNGFLGFITPNTYLTNKYMKPLRQFILDNTAIKKVVNHKEPVFVDASVDVATIILVKRKIKNNQIQILETKKENTNYNHLSFKTQEKWEENKENSFNTKASFNLKLTKTLPLSNICNSYFGIQAFDRKSSISNIKLNQDYMPVIDGGDIFPFQYAIPNKYFHFIDKNIKSGGDFNVYKEERIVIRQIGAIPIVGICKGNIVGSNTLYNVNLKDPNFDLKYILLVLNSATIKKYWLSLYSDSKQLFPKIKGYQLKEIPIKSISITEQQPFIEKADLMLSLNKELQTEKLNFINSLKEDKGVEKITRVLENFNELEYDAFKKELFKQKVKISLGNENNQWREYFNKIKQKVNELQSLINQTDKEIDRMVYELYELTAEEIEIVENSVNYK